MLFVNNGELRRKNFAGRISSIVDHRGRRAFSWVGTLLLVALAMGLLPPTTSALVKAPPVSSVAAPAVRGATAVRPAGPGAPVGVPQAWQRSDQGEGTRLVMWWSTLVPQHSRLLAQDPGVMATTPSDLEGLPAIVGIATIAEQPVLLGDDGSVWQRSERGAACARRSGTEPFYPGFRTVEGLPPITALAGGFCRMLARAADGTVWAWGSTWSVGAPTEYPPQPKRVPGLRSITAIAAARGHALAVDDAGVVWRWEEGDDAIPPKLAGATTPSPERVEGLPPVQAVAAGVGRSLALAPDGTVWSWQEPLDGPPAAVSELAAITQITAGEGHQLALRSDGTVWAWGANAWGQVDPTLAESWVAAPVAVAGPANVIAVIAGARHSLALLDDGTVQVWGYGSVGFPLVQLTTESPIDHVEAPVRPVVGLTSVIAVAAANEVSWAIQAPRRHALPTPTFR